MMAPMNFGGQSTIGPGGSSIYDPSAFTGGGPIGPGSLFNIMGAPIAVLGGVFSAGYPLGGPVSQVFRGSAIVPFTIFESTLSSAGPIGDFQIGRGGEDLGFGPSPIFLIRAPSIGPSSFIVGSPFESSSDLADF